MTISRFFQDTLGANLTNPRWSWGAVDPLRNIVFLRIWSEQIETIEGRRYDQIFWKKRKTQSFGYRERSKQTDAIRSGAIAFGIACIAKDPDTIGARSVESYQQDPPVKLRKLTKEYSCV